MNVRRLMARLAIADLEDLVVTDTDSQSLFLPNERSGMFNYWIFLKKARH